MTARPSPARAAPAADTLSNPPVVGHYSHNGHTIVWAQGEIDIATVNGLMQELANAAHGHQCRVIVDLTDVTFMDSTGLNALVSARRKASAGGGEVQLVGACALVRKILRITGLDQIFPVYSTIDEAIGAGAGAQHSRMQATADRGSHA